MKFNFQGLRIILANSYVQGALCMQFVFMVLYLVVLALLLAPMIVEFDFFFYDFFLEYLIRPIADWVSVLSGFYGAIRGLIFHPIFDQRYQEWLATTPWTSERPLPKGPVHLEGGDLVVVGVLSLVAFFLSLTSSGPDWLIVFSPFVAFAGAIALVWTIANWIVNQKAHAYMALCVPLAFGLLHVPLAGFIFCPFVAAGIAWRGVSLSLASFPWDGCDITMLQGKKKKSSVALVGWPYRTLLHMADEVRVSFRRAFLEGALAAGWVWFFLSSIKKGDPQEDLSVMMVLVAFLSALGGIGRLSSYGPAICSHLCWGRRVANKQWIIPRHDQIFLAPLLMIVVGWTLPWVLHYGFGWSIAISCGISVGFVVLIARAAGPSVRELQMTGVHSKFGKLLQTKEFITTSSSNS